jgi:predicted O-methyltransferase YrrM
MQSVAPAYVPPRRRCVTLPEMAPVDLTGLHTRYVHQGELAALIHLIGSVRPRSVIEFGANSGRTAKAILRNVPGIERYVGIDVPPGYVPEKQVQSREVPDRPGELALDDPRFRLLLAGRGSHDLAPDDLPDADAAFIDGDHSARGVRRDYALAKAKVRPGGIIVFHDDNGRDTVDVSRVLDELAHGGAPIVHVDSTWLAYERIEAV